MFTRFFICLLSGAALLLLLSTLPARAADFTAATADELIAAVAAANGNTEADTINLVGNPAITLTAPLEITADLTIVGPGTLSGAGVHTLLLLIDAAFTLDNLTFRECSTSRGAVAVGGAALSVTRCTFVDCIADNVDYFSGGAITGDAAHVTLTDSIFTGNTTVTDAGAIITRYGSLTVSGCTFTGNASPWKSYWGGYGGAITGAECPVTLTDSTFSGNTSMSMGGAVSCFSAYFSLNGCTFTENSAAYFGGALAFMGPGMEANNCTFTGNRSLLGGAIFYQEYDDDYDEETDYWMWLTGCVFHDNSVEGTALTDFNMAIAGGGAIAAIGDAVALNCRFTKNQARFIHATDDMMVQAVGGAVLSSGGWFGAANCVFSANSVTSVNTSSFGGAQAIGGAIGTFGDWYYELFALNCTFSGNTATASANAPDMASAVGGGITLAGPVDLRNCILWGNLANGTPNQAEYIVGDWPYPSVSHCDIQDNPGGIWDGMGNIDADPAFVRNPGSGEDGIWGTADDDAGDLALTAGSPCIDAGSNDHVSPELMATDLAGNPRIVNDIVDMGAYEYQGGTVQDAILDLQDAVQALINAGVQLPADGRSLQVKLQYALDCLAAGDLVTARGAIGAFINQVQAFLQVGKLTQAQADALLTAANAILAMLE
ncbi:MAG: right-handed parallel beta-helix repeat-containing protein [Armatimonadota bacterium]